MNSLVRQFFTVSEKDEMQYKEVLFLGENTNITWEEISKRAPDLIRGWFELSRISPLDRVEFTRDYWLDRLPYHPVAHPLFYEFFDQLDDVAVVLTRQNDEALAPELVYSLEDNSCFFRGKPPCSEEDLLEMKNEIGISLPRDYLAFNRIHSGFGKLSEMGILSVGEIGDAKRRILEMIIRSERHLKSGKNNGTRVDPGSLIPFYEAMGLSSFQCFYADWYPGSEMGNVYLSGIDYTISDTRSWADSLAFPTFMEWLAYYLEGMNVSP